MNRYKAFYRGKTVEFYALTTCVAVRRAIAFFKMEPKDERKLVVMLCEANDATVVHASEEEEEE